ncbi:MAG: pyridoxamine 5'-phosphate oxidase family protein [Planctomycetota bacterium]
MSDTHAKIDDRLRGFIEAQPMFFVATAPLADDGRINVSPKGLAGTFAVLGEHEVAYLDTNGSGAETIAHLRENGRITLMFNAFDSKPNILRLYGRGEAIFTGDQRFDEYRSKFADAPDMAWRSIIRIDVERVATSCGYGVPLMTFERHRDQLVAWTNKQSDAKLAAYQAKKNRNSIDGLPAVEA